MNYEISGDMRNLMLIRFFKKEVYAAEFQKSGAIYFNRPSTYRETTLSNGQQDSDETLYSINQGNLISIKIGDSILKPKNLSATLRLFDHDPNYLQYSFYHIPFQEIIDGTFRIDKKMDKEFGWHFVAVPYFEFLQKIEAAEKKIVWQEVQYVDYSKHNGSRTPFMKDLSYKYQREFRFLLNGTYTDPQKINVGSLQEISVRGYCKPSDLKLMPVQES